MYTYIYIYSFTFYDDGYNRLFTYICLCDLMLPQYLHCLLHVHQRLTNLFLRFSIQNQRKIGEVLSPCESGVKTTT